MSQFELDSRASADRTCLQANSPPTGNFTGKFAILGSPTQFRDQRPLRPAAPVTGNSQEITGNSRAISPNAIPYESALPPTRYDGVSSALSSRCRLPELDSEGAFPAAARCRRAGTGT